MGHYWMGYFVPAKDRPEMLIAAMLFLVLDELQKIRKKG
jgi:hypothetical protein